MFHIKNLLSKAASTIEYSLIGDLRQLLREGPYYLLQSRAMHDPEGRGVARIGPRYFGKHLVLYTGNGNLETVKQQITTVMDLPGAHARDPYHVFTYVTGATFFLSMTAPEALKLRKQIVPYLTASYFVSHTQEICDSLFREYFSNKSGKNFSNAELTSHVIYRAFGQRILGLTLSDQMIELLDQLNNISNKSFFLPKFALQFDRNLQLLKQKVDVVTKQFLQENHEQIRLQFADKNPSLLVNFIKEQLPIGYKPEDLTVDDLARLSCHPKVRVCLFILMPVKNISKVLTKALSALANIPELAGKLLDEESMPKDRRSPSSRSVMKDFYENLILIAAPAESILRYSDAGVVHTPNSPMSIPPNSIVVYQLDRLPPGEILQFGLKSRQCPAFDLAGQFVKSMILAFAKNALREFDGVTVRLGDPVRELKYSQSSVRISINVDLFCHASLFSEPLAYSDGDHRKLFYIEDKAVLCFGGLVKKTDALALNTILPGVAVLAKSGIKGSPKLNKYYEMILNEQVSVLLEVVTDKHIESFCLGLKKFTEEVDCQNQVRKIALKQAGYCLPEHPNAARCITIHADSPALLERIRQSIGKLEAPVSINVARSSQFFSPVGSVQSVVALIECQQPKAGDTILLRL